FVISVLALFVAVRARAYMVGFALNFGIYVYYDLARLYAWEVSESLLSSVFLVATLAALVSMVGIVKKPVGK
ncbi:MAG: hypothetical protein KBD17_02830, partial [Candidatus Pacebacteria bacterium]|nr:hypothetical protein [Candidatus Paceibacterota bacterium]